MEQPTRHLVAVYPDEQAARSAAAQLEGAGVERDRIRIGRPEDQATALVAEMRAETDEAWLGPQAGVLLTKESARGAAVGVPVLAAVGAVVALLLTPLVLSSLPVWGRLIILGGLGAFAGAAAGFILGGGEAEKGATQTLAAERGVALRVTAAEPRVEHLLAASRPIRLDRVADGDGETGAVTTDEGPGRQAVLDDLRTAWREGDGRG